MVVTTTPNQQHKCIYTFQEARKMARSYGLASATEFLEYECPGAYRLPRNPDEVWSDEWNGWDDFLGVPWSFSEARCITRDLNKNKNNQEDSHTLLLQSSQDYEKFVSECHGTRSKNNKPGETTLVSQENVDVICRLPIRPDLYYKTEWNGWDDFLGLSKQQHG
ncbi:hypothetical protein ACA910_007246 [Epithemia clementina (nom. ined.)]